MSKRSRAKKARAQRHEFATVQGDTIEVGVRLNTEGLEEDVQRVKDATKALGADGIECFAAELVDVTFADGEGADGEGADAPGERIKDVRWYAGDKVLREDYWTGERYYLQLSMDPKHANLEELNSGAPVLNNHSRWDLADVLGVVEDDSATVSPKGGKARLRFSDGDEVTPIWNKIEEGIIRNVSVGFIVHKLRDITEKGDELSTFLAIDWTPNEISAVPIGASKGAQLLAGEPSQLLGFAEIVNRAPVAHKERKNPMAEDTKTAAAGGTDKTQPVEEDVTLGEKRTMHVVDTPTPEDLAETRRTDGIIKLAAQVDEVEAGKLALLDKDMTVDKFRADLLEARATKDDAGPSGITFEGRDEQGTLREGIQDAIMYRANPAKYELTEPGQDWVQFSLIDMMRDYAQEKQGRSVRRWGPNKLIEFALHTTDDFPNILAASAAKTLMDGYLEGNRSFLPISTFHPLKDFKVTQMVKRGLVPALAAITEGGEFSYGTIGEGQEPIVLTSYGRIFGISRQAIINDDLSAFSGIGPDMGKSAAQMENEQMWLIFTANGDMADGDAIFHANHSNLGTAGAPSITTLDEAKTDMRNQTDPVQSKALNLVPAYAIVPAEHENVMGQLLRDVTYNATAANSTVQLQSTFKAVIVEPILGAASTTAYYFAADPTQMPGVVHAYLTGQTGPSVVTQNPFLTDGMQWRVSHDFGTGVADHRPLYKNAGA